MTRPLRIDEPGLWHHVMNRGLAGSAVFQTDEDRTDFLSLVAVCQKRWTVRTHAYVLMGTHYHLLVEDVDGHLSRAMRHLDGLHTQYFNRRHHRDGPLFRGRFRSRVVQTERYLVEVVRYIHQNPVRAKMVSRASEYLWSSHRHYLASAAPEWLVVHEVLESLGGDDVDGRRVLAEFVDEPIPDEVLGQMESWSPFLGTETYVEGWRSRFIAEGRKPRAEVPAERQLLAPSCDAIIDAAAEVFSVEVESIRAAQRGEHNIPRQLAMLVALDCTPATRKAVAETFRVGLGSVSSLATKARKQIQPDNQLAELLMRLKERLEL